MCSLLELPIDFYILSMEEESLISQFPLILGRPLLKIIRTKIYVYEGTWSMKFGDNVVRFNIPNSLQTFHKGSFCFQDGVVRAFGSRNNT